MVCCAFCLFRCVRFWRVRSTAVVSVVGARGRSTVAAARLQDPPLLIQILVDFVMPFRFGRMLPAHYSRPDEKYDHFVFLNEWVSEDTDVPATNCTIGIAALQ